MDPIVKQQHIASLILKEKILELSPAEQQELNSWRQADPQNEQTYAHLNKKDFSDDLSRYRKIDARQDMERFRAGNTVKVRHAVRWYWVAAVAVLMIGVSTIFFTRENGNNSNHKMAHRVSVAPGSSKAMLVMDNGRVVNLADEKETEISMMDGLSIKNNGNELRYSLPEKVEGSPAVVYNELIIPKGGEFMVTLSDGTKVWLNSQSKLKYPVVFGDSTREVILEGEAYFEVKKDAKHPFRVHANDDVCIEVLGTSFDVRCYPDEHQVETVLEEGSVRVKQGTKSVILTPGYKATCVPGEAMQTRPVSTEEYTAWRRGQYVFTNERVEDILKQLSRWYNVEIFYSNEAVKEIMFSGDVQKYDDINTFLEAMEIAGEVSFQINNGVIIVDRGN